ncbi:MULTISPECIES: Dps family protein [Cellulophaga]|jgi:starvation-inducible DNA-binding protein|uniref:Starvation-inducible DNA-binding protein n=1 Tax=Cellulophaga baltica TaxID=76594 RepID=A0A1G7DEV7_9FLAO|nr:MULTISPECIES: DNA starvation/stationary phase protection protein [Cellulophaga]MBA6313591.1 DNA starvation/stationary phase protection protein [Cellulophaga baltica]QXP51344.1 DNA starvation/stationary phase protection protein [Cellulophaga sp. HaHa_2_1]QXP56330.1 DNA starvation/stationary phase protection protein [Cellulophaga sp. HaHa_2_95]SDE49560.1 starvation-inducible DNA-binding protein [Cellulophaga baltica]
MKSETAEIGIKKSNRKAVVEMLEQLLADEFLMYTKYRNAHWNVEGHDFHTKHVYFEEEYGKLETILDAVAERIRMLGFYSPGSMKRFIELSQLDENGPEQNDSISFMEILLEDHQKVIAFIRKSIGENAEEHNDEGTADFITGIMQQHEEMAWMLRASVKKF